MVLIVKSNKERYTLITTIPYIHSPLGKSGLFNLPYCLLKVDPIYIYMEVVI